MIHWVVFGFSSFSGCLEICLESNILLSEFVACLTRHLTCPIFALLEVMHRMSTALHLPVAYDDIIGQLTNDNDNYKFSTCPYSILQEFAVENEVTIITNLKIERELLV